MAVLISIAEIKKLAACIPQSLSEDTLVKLEVSAQTIKLKSNDSDTLIIYHTNKHLNPKNNRNAHT